MLAFELLPYGLVGIIDVVLVLAVALLWFEIPTRGSLALLFGMTLIYLLCRLGLGLRGRVRSVVGVPAAEARARRAAFKT
jgi:hypothetical protein